MKSIKSIFFIVVGILVLYSCKNQLSVQPHNGRTFQEALNNVSGIKTATQGIYAKLVLSGYQSFAGRSYTARLLNFGEMPGDNIVMGIPTPDPLEHAFDYERTPSMSNVLSAWTTSYRIIFAVNQNIDAADKLMKNGDVSSDDMTTLKQLKGENLFLRAKTYFDLVRAFGRPYIQNPSQNPGVPIVLKPDVNAKKPRATVKAVYGQIVKDLTNAEGLMTKEKPNSYASKQVAQALLSRVYLYMGENQKVIDYSNKVITSKRYSLLPASSYLDMFSMPNEDNPEVIWAIHHDSNQDFEFASYASMYYSSPKGVGWGEMFASKSLRDLLNIHPNDVRKGFIELQFKVNAKGDTTYPLYNSKYKEYYFTKFTYQDGKATLSSPPYIRYAEMFLNRAEAYAKLKNKTKAIADVNKIRKRAGLQDSALYNADNMTQQEVLNAVLRERRLEFFEEGFRAYDIFRNNRPMKRDYPSSVAGHLTIQPDADNVIYPIPQDAIFRNSKLKQNPGYGTGG